MGSRRYALIVETSDGWILMTENLSRPVANHLRRCLGGDKVRVCRQENGLGHLLGHPNRRGAAITRAMVLPVDQETQSSGGN